MRLWRTATVLAAGIVLGAGGTIGGGGTAAVARPADDPVPSTGATHRVSVSTRGVQGDADSAGPAVSRDGRYVVFTSSASNLVPGDTNRSDDIFVRDGHTGTTTRVSVTSTGAQARHSMGSSEPSISSNGRYVVFMSGATNLICSRRPFAGEMYVHDLRTGKTTCIRPSNTGAVPNEYFGAPWISADGRYVTFTAYASNLVAGDTNGVADVFVHDRVTRKTTRADLSDRGTQLAGDSSHGTISADGRYVAFESTQHVFVRDRVAHTTTLVSSEANDLPDDGWCGRPSVSADGGHIAFVCVAPAVGPDGVDAGHAFVWDRTTGTSRILGRSIGAPTLSADGRYVAYMSQDPGVVPTDGWGIVVRDLRLDEAVVVRTTTSPLDYSALYTPISADGRHVTFATTDRLGADDTNGKSDAFVHDLGWPGRSTERLSVTNGGA
jgi:Tol biopolymer transport system component